MCSTSYLPSIFSGTTRTKNLIKHISQKTLQEFSGLKIFKEKHFQRMWGFPGGIVDMNLPAKAGGTGLIPGAGRSTCHRATKPMGHNY